MAGFKVDFFKGTRPRVSTKKLRPGEAQIAENLLLGSGDLEPIPDKSTVQAVNGSNARTIYLYDNDGTDIWFEWTDYVQVARGPIKNDAYNRVYYTNDTTGNGAPKFTTSTLADGGGGGPYPEGWLYIGVPAPGTAPTVSTVQLPEDVSANLRYAYNFKTDAFEIDRIRYTVHPGTGTDNDTWRLNSGATDYIRFDVPPGTAFRVTEVINNNRVKIESATEPGLTIRTLNQDKSTSNDWMPMDEQGSTKEADFLGWKVPPGMEITIPGAHKLAVGDVITVTATNGNIFFAPATTVDFYAQDWDPEVTINEGGTDYEEHYGERITAAAADDGTKFQTIIGDFYYDVDRASSDASELEDRTYVYTYVNAFGEEGPPSPPSVVTPQLDGRSVLISGMELPPTVGYNITKMRLYRSNSTEAGTEYQFVKEFNLSRTTRDEVESADLGEVIPSTTWDPPPADMHSIVSMPNGMMVGASGRTVHFCEPYFPHAWPADYDQAIDYNIIGLAAFGQNVAVLTEGWPYIVSGSHPRNAVVRPIKVNQACVSKESIATDGNKVYYASNDGLCEIDSDSFRIVTEPYLDEEDWLAYEPSTMVGSFYEGRYHGFWGFDASAVEAVITAELSGTITNADESDIIDGGRTIIITLTNDLWVAAGTSFDNQRANIIAGLDAATSQTLGWNNELRDSELSVTDVVRTDDTTVTITLPAAPGYAIVSAETITCTIPAAALQVSNSDVVAGSTFTIQPDAPTATVTIGGSVSTEAEVVAGGETITLTLTGDTWVDSGDFTDALVEELILGLQATTDELNGWNDTVPQEIDVADVVRTSDTVVTITLDAVADYSVTANETITATVPHELLTTQEDVDATSSNSIGITATGVVSAIFGGTAVSAGLTENEVIAGGKTITITLTNDTWIAAGTGPIGTTAQSDALVQAIVAQTSPTNGWNNQVSLDNTDLVRTSNTVATITLPAAASYSISSDETLSCEIPNAVLTTSTSDLTVSNTIGITAQSPAICTLSGTVTGSIEEDVIVDGGETIILTLTNDTWVAAGATFDGQRQNIIDGITAASSPTNGWNNEVRDTDLSPSDVVRTSDTVVTITLPASASYDISSTETITATVPASALEISASAVVASPTFTVDPDLPASAAITGTADGANQDDIRNGGRTIIITLSDDTWVASGATFNAQRQNIIDGLDAASSPTNGWNNEVRDGTLDVTNVVRTSDTVVTITLPATPAYSISAAEAITVTVPASALTQSAINVTGDVTVDIAIGLDTSNMMACVPVSEDDGDYAFAQDSFTSWTEGEAGTFTASIRNNANIAYSATDDAWIIAYNRGSSGASGRMNAFRSLNDGSSWTQVQDGDGSVLGPIPHGIMWHDDQDVFVQIAEDGWYYSTNGGASWTGYDFVGSVSVGDFFNARPVWGGANYFYFGPESDFSDLYLYRSADLSGGGNPMETTPTEISLAFGSPASSVSVSYNGIVSGNGKVLVATVVSADDDIRISSVAHGGTTENYIGAIDVISSSNFNSRLHGVFTGTQFFFFADNGKCIYVDAGDEGTIGNWTARTSFVSDFSGYEMNHFYWDPGTNGDDGLGIVAVGKNSSTGKGVIFTSDDGLNWTLRETLTTNGSDIWMGASKHLEDLS